MTRLILGLIIAVEIFALLNKGGGPLMAHLFLTLATIIIGAILVLREPIRFRLTLASGAYLLFFLFFVLSFLTSVTPEYGLSELLLFANGGLLFFLISGTHFAEKDTKWFGIALVSFAVIDTLAGYFFYTRGAFPRLAGTFFDPSAPQNAAVNAYANFLVLVLPVAAALVFQKHERRTTTVLSGFALAILLSGFLLSFSRAAWIALFAVAVGFFAWRFFSGRKGAAVLGRAYFSWRRIAAVLAVTAILVSGLQYTRSRQFETFSVVKKLLFQADEGAASASYRMEYWQGAVKIIKRWPLLGTGVQSFRNLFPKVQQTFGIAPDHPHNVFFKIAVENGIPAAAFFFLFLGAVFWTAGASAASVELRRDAGSSGSGLRKLMRPQGATSSEFYMLNIAALAAIFHNLLDFNFIVANFTLFMVFLAFLATPVALPPPSQTVSRGFALAGLFLILLTVHEGFYQVDFKFGRAQLAGNDVDEALPLLENAQKLFFPRDAKYFLAEAYRQKYESTKDLSWLDREAQLFKPEEAERNAEAAFRIGMNFFERNHYIKAHTFFGMSLALDPMNKLKYYYFFLKSAGETDPISRQQKEITMRRLTQYTEALRENRLFTILSDNPSYASQLYEFFGMGKEKKEFDRLWFGEVMKYTQKYGPPRISGARK